MPNSRFDTGKRLFEKVTIPASYTLVDSKLSPSGLIISRFKRAGKAKQDHFEFRVIL